MKRPLDIPQEIWENIPEQLRLSLSRNVNRSFINPVIEKNFKKMKHGSVLTHKINTSLNELRALVIEAVKQGSSPEVLSLMVGNQQVMMEEMLAIDKDVNELLSRVKEFLNFVNSRVDHYKEIL